MWVSFRSGDGRCWELMNSLLETWPWPGRSSSFESRTLIVRAASQFLDLINKIVGNVCLMKSGAFTIHPIQTTGSWATDKLRLYIVGFLANCRTVPPNQSQYKPAPAPAFPSLSDCNSFSSGNLLIIDELVVCAFMSPTDSRHKSARSALFLPSSNL